MNFWSLMRSHTCMRLSAGSCPRSGTERIICCWSVLSLRAMMSLSGPSSCSLKSARLMRSASVLATSATTVALRGAPCSSAASPKKSPWYL